MDLFDNILTAAYTGTGFVDLVGFFPQIYVLVMATGLSKGISLRAWGLWTVTTLIGLIYAVIIVKDIFLIFVSAVEFLGCFVIFAIACYNRYYRFPHLDGSRKADEQVAAE